MTEIHVQRKERKLWPWVAGLAVVLLLLFVITDRRDDREEVAAGDVAREPIVPDRLSPDAAPRTWLESQRFIVFVRDTQPDFGEINAAHEYTRNGLRYLASALDEIARQDSATAPAVRPKIAALRVGAETLRENAAAPQHADAVAVLFRQAAEAIAEVQRARFPDAADEVSAVRAAASAVDAERPLLEQRDAVKAFFDRSVEAVRSMGAPEPGTSTNDGGR